MKISIIGRYGAIVAMVASATFGVFSLINYYDPSPTIKSGTINPSTPITTILQDIESDAVLGGSGIDHSSVADIDLDVLMNELLTESNDTHNAPSLNYISKLQSLCQIFHDICDIINVQGAYTPQTQYAYQLMLIYMINKLDNYGYDPMESLQNITINNYTKNKRGYANAGLMVINTYQISSYKEYLQVLAHELGHVIDLGPITGISSQIDHNYTEFGVSKFSVDDPSLGFYRISRINENTLRSEMSATDFVSGYAMSNPFEDFAESNNMYLYHREIFAYLASSSSILLRKYNYFNSLYDSNYLSNNFKPTDLTKLTTSYRPWDTTRL